MQKSKKTSYVLKNIFGILELAIFGITYSGTIIGDEIIELTETVPKKNFLTKAVATETVTIKAVKKTVSANSSK